MEFIIAGTIWLYATNLLYYRKFRKVRKQHRKVRAKLKKQIDVLDNERRTTEQKLHELEDLVFDHVSILEEQEMPAFEIAKPLISWVGTKKQLDAACVALGYERQTLAGQLFIKKYPQSEKASHRAPPLTF